MSTGPQYRAIRTTPKACGDAAGLRRRAEARLQRRGKPRALPGAEADAKRLLHELQVHHVELEMQNAELSRARAEAEANAEKFADLYDFAPVGYVTLDEQGLIRELNFSAASLLGRDRAKLAGQPLVNWVAPKNRACFQDHLRAARGKKARQCAEVEIRAGDGRKLTVQLGTICRHEEAGARSYYRTVLTDVTDLKQAEEKVRRLNGELEERVVLRTMEIAALLEKSRHMQAQLRQLSHRVLGAQEEERKRISRELHDEVAQILISINLDLMALSRGATTPNGAFRKRIERTQALVEGSVNALRRFMRELRPPTLDDLGLIPSLAAYLEDFKKRTGIRVRFTAYPGVEQLGSVSRVTFFRVAQSALSNVVLHAKASRVAVRIQQRPQAACMEIEDDGIGFEPNGGPLAKAARRLGLLGMKERMGMVGGTFTVESAPGHGTVVRAEIPVMKGKQVTKTQVRS